MAEHALARPGQLAVGPIGRNGLGYWGVAMLIATEAALFGYLLFSYYYNGATQPPGWILEPAPKMFPAVPNTVLLLASSGVVWWGEKGIEAGRRGQALLGFGITFLMGAIFAAVQIYEWLIKPFGFAANSYSSLYFTTTAFHMAHVIAGLIILAALFGWTALDYFSPRRRIVVSAGVLYWHFVDVVWVFVFTTYYLTPYLGFGT
ncbi:MAG: heme-copper oxidase subunit III [Sphingomonadaceae bacterium]|nr:heme-copper oxidase subunit III [Sphingomonadaceae bacterium]